MLIDFGLFISVSGAAATCPRPFKDGWCLWPDYQAHPNA